MPCWNFVQKMKIASNRAFERVCDIYFSKSANSYFWDISHIPKFLRESPLNEWTVHLCLDWKSTQHRVWNTVVPQLMHVHLMCMCTRVFPPQAQKGAEGSTSTCEPCLGSRMWRRFGIKRTDNFCFTSFCMNVLGHAWFIIYIQIWVSKKIVQCKHNRSFPQCVLGMTALAMYLSHLTELSSCHKKCSNGAALTHESRTTY